MKLHASTLPPTQLKDSLLNNFYVSDVFKCYRPGPTTLPPLRDSDYKFQLTKPLEALIAGYIRH